MGTWYERAYEEIDYEYESGYIKYTEYQRLMRELAEEIKETELDNDF